MTGRRSWGLLALLLAVSATCASCSGSAPTGRDAKKSKIPKAKADPGLVPRSVFSADPDRTQVRLSPDGKWLSWLAPYKGVLNVFVAPFDAPDRAEPLTRIEDRPIARHFWAFDGAFVLYFKDSSGDENHQLYAVDVKSREIRNLTDAPGCRVELVKMSPKRPNELLVAINERDARHHDLHRVEIRTRRRSLVFKNEAGYARFVADEDLTPRFGELITPDGGARLHELKKGSAPAVFAEFSPGDAPMTRAWRLDASGRTLYMLDARGRETAAIVSVDVARRKITPIFEDPRADVTSGLFSPRSGKLIAVSVEWDRLSWKVIDPSFAEDLQSLEKETRGDFTVEAQSLDDQRWIVVDDSDAASPRHLAYDRKQKRLTPLFSEKKALESVALGGTQVEMVKARDGLPLLTYVSLPANSDPDGDRRPVDPLPTVLLVQGRLASRAHWGHSDVVQWLTSRGYAVIRTHPRGTRGFGRKFLDAGRGEWGGRRHDDLVDVARWAVEQSIAEDERVAIMGSGYGGYSALLGLTFTPEIFACAVDVAGPSNLATWLESLPPYWAPSRPALVADVGASPDSEDGKKLLALRSPLARIDRVNRPLLVAHGANDPLVRASESEQLVQAMSDQGRAVTYLVYPDEGHGFARAPNRLAFDAVTEVFLAECLGGLYQPITLQDLSGSSLRVPAGLDQVEGLAPALEAEVRRRNALSRR